MTVTAGTSATGPAAEPAGARALPGSADQAPVTKRRLAVASLSRADAQVLDAALEPVRQALLAVATTRAEQVRAAAAAAAAEVLGEARRRADAILAEARRQGGADAATARAGALARARRQARARTLATRRQTYERLRAQVRTEITAMVDEPGYPRLRERLAGVVKRELGDGAVVREAPGGGVIGEAPGRRLDLSLRSFAERAADRLAGDLDPALSAGREQIGREQIGRDAAGDEQTDAGAP